MEKALPLPGQVFPVDGLPAFLIAPPAGLASAHHGWPWVWYAPTLPGLPGDEERWMFTHFLAAGVAVAGIDVGESYGSVAGRAGFSALYRHLVQDRGLARRPCLLARSRGGLMLYNWAVENPDAVAGIAAIYPVCNPASWPGLAQACPAYGLSEVEMARELDRHNPVARVAPLAEARVPLFHLHGDQDTVVPLAENSAALLTRYRQLGGPATLLVPPGQGHSMWEGFFHCQELVDFAIDCSLKAAGAR
jgi:alpha-beta hydrolase superfamily lysophospholipase